MNCLTHSAKLLALLIALNFAVAWSLAAQTHAEKERINAAETAAAHGRAKLAHPEGRFDDKVDAIMKVTQADINAAFTTKSDMDYFLKQEAWRKENQRRIDFENSPAARAQAEAAIEAVKLRKKKAQAAQAAQEAAEEAAIEAKNLKFKTGVLETAHDLVRRAQASEVAKMNYAETTSLISLAEALLTDGEFVVLEARTLGFGGAETREALALELYALIGWIPGGDGGRYNENRWVRRRVMDIVMPAALLKGGRGDVVVRQVRELNAIAGADARTQMQIAVGLASALAMPKGDLSPTQRNLAAALLADRARDIPAGTGRHDDQEGTAFSWMLLTAAGRMPELARAPSLKPHFDAQSNVRPRSAWHSSTPTPKPADFAATIKATAQGNWWNLAGMLTLAENSRFPHPWFAAIRSERRATRQASAPAESRATIQRALDDWFTRNGATPEVRKLIQADCDLACEAGVEKLGDSAAWDEFMVADVADERAGDQGLTNLLTSARLKEALEASGGDTAGAQRWLVDPRWQPDAKATRPSWRAWLELAGPVGVGTVVARNPEYLADPWFFRRGVESVRLTDDGQMSDSSLVVVNTLLRHATDITDPPVVRAFAVIRGSCLGDWVALAAWLDDPRRQPKPGDPLYALYERANSERDQVAGKLEKFKLGSDEDFGRCVRFEAWLKEVLKAKGAVRATLLAECPDKMLAQPDPRIVGYDVERGGLATRALLLLAQPEFDPHKVAKNGGRYDPEPWLTAVAKLSANVSMDELVAQLAVAVRSAWTEQRSSGDALDSNFSLRTGAACQRALGRLATRWSSARKPAQEEVLKLQDNVLVFRPSVDGIEVRIKWERALMQGLNAADAFAQASQSLRRPELSYLADLNNESPTSLPPLVLANDDHFFREARRALAQITAP